MADTAAAVPIDLEGVRDVLRRILTRLCAPGTYMNCSYLGLDPEVKRVLPDLARVLHVKPTQSGLLSKILTQAAAHGFVELSRMGFVHQVRLPSVSRDMTASGSLITSFVKRSKCDVY
jgi:hypothetical protein